MTPETRRLDALLFDFDHTLADLGRWVDWQAARDGIQALYAEVGLDVMEILRARRGHSPMAILDTALHARASPTVAAAVQAKVYAILESVECEGAERAELLPGAEAVVRMATAAGVRVGIVTANAESAARRVLTRWDLEAEVGVVVGRTIGLPLKPAPDMFLSAAQRLGVAAMATIAVGDSPGDAEGAVAAGMLAVGVLGGEAGQTRLFDAGATWVLQDLTVLPLLLTFWQGESAR